MTDDERKIAEILLTHLPTKDATGPIQEAGKAMLGWDSAKAKSFVADMVQRGLVQIKSKPKQKYDSEDRQESWWELGDAIPTSYKGKRAAAKLRPATGGRAC
jgi:hypothetical protein